MAPRRPVLFPEQYFLAGVTVFVLIGSIAAFVVVLSYR